MSAVAAACGVFCSAVCQGKDAVAVADALHKLEKCVRSNASHCSNGYSGALDRALATGACLCLRRFSHLEHSADSKFLVPLLRTLGLFYGPLRGKSIPQNGQVHWALSAALIDLLADSKNADSLIGPDWRRAKIAECLALLWTSHDDRCRAQFLKDSDMLPVVGHAVYILLRTFEKAQSNDTRISCIAAVRALLFGHCAGKLLPLDESATNTWSLEDFWIQNNEKHLRDLVERGRCSVDVVTAILPGILTSLWSALSGLAKSENQPSSSSNVSHLSNLWPGWLIANCIRLMDLCMTTCLRVTDTADHRDGPLKDSEKHLEAGTPVTILNWSPHQFYLCALAWGAFYRAASLLPLNVLSALHLDLRMMVFLQSSPSTSLECGNVLRQRVVSLCSQLCRPTLPPDGKVALFRQMCVLLQLLTPSDVCTLCLVPQSVRQICDAFIYSAVALPQDAAATSAILCPTETSVHSNDDDIWSEIRLCDVRDWRPFCRAAQLVGATCARAGQLGSLIDYVVPMIQGHDYDPRKSASAVLFYDLIVCSALDDNSSKLNNGRCDLYLIDRLVDVCLSVINEVENDQKRKDVCIPNRQASVNDQHAQVDLVLSDERVEDLQTALDDRSVLLCRLLHAISAEPCISSAFSALHYQRTHLQTTIYPLLYLQASSQPIVRSHALRAMEGLARGLACPMPGVKDLDTDEKSANRLHAFLCANLDYILNELSRRLLQFGRHRRAALALRVLCELLATGAHGIQDIVPETGPICDLAHQTFLALDTHHLTNAAPFLVALSAIANLLADLNDVAYGDQSKCSDDRVSPNVRLSESGEIETAPPNLCESTCAEMLERARHVLASEHTPLRIHALKVMMHAFRGVRHNPDVLLPSIHKCWPVLSARWRSATAVADENRARITDTCELGSAAGLNLLSRSIGVNVLEVVALMVRYSDRFMSRRIQEDFLHPSISYLRHRSTKADCHFTHGHNFKLILAMFQYLPQICDDVKISVELRDKLCDVIRLYVAGDGTVLAAEAKVAAERLKGESFVGV